MPPPRREWPASGSSCKRCVHAGLFYFVGLYVVLCMLGYPPNSAPQIRPTSWQTPPSSPLQTEPFIVAALFPLCEFLHHHFINRRDREGALLQLGCLFAPAILGAPQVCARASVSGACARAVPRPYFSLHQQPATPPHPSPGLLQDTDPFCGPEPEVAQLAGIVGLMAENYRPLFTQPHNLKRYERDCVPTPATPPEPKEGLGRQLAALVTPPGNAALTQQEEEEEEQQHQHQQQQQQEHLQADALIVDAEEGFFPVESVDPALGDLLSAWLEGAVAGAFDAASLPEAAPGVGCAPSLSLPVPCKWAVCGEEGGEGSPWSPTAVFGTTPLSESTLDGSDSDMSGDGFGGSFDAATTVPPRQQRLQQEQQECAQLMVLQ
jgi:hypothetical protein